MGRTSVETGLIPTLNVRTKISDLYSITTEAQSRQSLYKSNAPDGQQLNHRNILTDLSLLGSRKIGLNMKITGGYLLRFRDNDLFHRAVQQFSLVSLHRSLRLGHRFASDQTFSGENNADTEVRLRYRLATEIPLQGASLEAKEYYLKINQEYLNAFQSGQHDLEIRTGFFLGNYLSSKNILEYGVDYRVGSIFSNGTTKHAIWLRVNWYFQYP